MDYLDCIENKFELPISINYVKSWGLPQAVRELLQNAIDSESPFEYEFIDDELWIHSRFSQLTPESLLLGCTSKEENPDAIGSFGEGYKIALLVLARLNYKVTLFNGDVNWNAIFVDSKKYNATMLCIEERKAPEPNQGLSIKISGISEQDIETIKESCLYMQKSLGEVKQVTKGTILIDRPGKLYVNGLFVCDTQMKYGYDVKPEHLSLERDRQTVCSFDLSYLTGEMWCETKDLGEVSKLIESGIPDLENVTYTAPAIVKEACYDLFRKKNPGAIAASSQKELDSMVERGMTNVKIVNSTYHSCITTSKPYRNEVKIAPPPTPTEILVDFFGDESGIAIDNLIEKSKNWRVK